MTPIGNLIYHAYVFGWMVALFWKRFTISLPTAASFLLVGVYPAMLISILLSWPLLGTHSSAALLTVPLIEETAKILPVVLYFWYLRRNDRWQASASDGLLLGWLVGAGFAFHEDAMRGIVSGQGWFASRYSPLLPTIASTGAGFQAGHAVWSALAGLAVAFAFLYRKDRRVWAIPILVFALVVLDHARADAQVSTPYTAAWLLPILGNGQVTILLLLAAIAAVFVLEGKLLAGVAQRDWRFTEVALRQFIKPDALIVTLRRLSDVINYQRLRRAAHYRVWQWGGNVAFEHATDMAITLNVLAERIGLNPDSRFEEVLVLSIPADRKRYPSEGLGPGGSPVTST